MGKAQRRRAVQRTWDEIEAIVAEYENSELTQATFARRHRIALSTLTNWLRRVRAEPEQGIEASEGEFIEVIAENGVHRDRGAEYEFELLFDAGVGVGECAVRRPGALRVSGLRIAAGFDGASLERLLEVLSNVQGRQPVAGESQSAGVKECSK